MAHHETIVETHAEVQCSWLPNVAFVTKHKQVVHNESGDVLDVNSYHMVRPLGTGSFATVHLCTRAGDGIVKIFSFLFVRLNFIVSYWGYICCQIIRQSCGKPCIIILSDNESNCPSPPSQIGSLSASGPSRQH